MFFLSTRLGALRARPGEPKASFWVRQNEAFGRAVARLDWGNADTAYAFNGAALEMFQRARAHGVRCVLDQTAAPWRYNTQLLGLEQARWPGWEDCPADMDAGGHMMAREEAEWELADQIVCGSPFVAEAIRSVGGPSGKCRVVPYPIPDVPRLFDAANACRAVRVVGLMTLPPLPDEPEDARPWFRRLRDLRDEWRAVGVPASMLRELSMGMSADFEVAVQEGATIVRVGTAIFGSRHEH